MATALRVGVIGIQHLHVFEMVHGLVEAGATTHRHASSAGPLEEMCSGWRSESVRCSESDVLAGPSLDLIVIGSVPAGRGAVAIDAMNAGHHVLVAKPAVTTAEDLERCPTNRSSLVALLLGTFH